MHHHRPPIGGDACYWLGLRPERGPNVEHSVGLVEGTEADRFEDASGTTHLQWRMQTDPTELAEFCDSSGGLVPTLNIQRQNWRSPAFCGPQGTLCCHFEWVPPRYGSSRLWPCPVLAVGTLLVARNDHQVQPFIKSCLHCLQHEGNLPKAPLHLIVSTTSMDLLHVDFTSIEMTMEPNRLPKVANILVFQDHFTKHMMAYVTPNQTAKTVAKFLYQGYILIFGALVLLSDHGANFMSSIISEMFKLLSMKKLWTSPYHPQTNGLVDRSHQTIMWMTGKLGED